MSVSVFPYNDIVPDIHKSVFLAEGVRVMGDVCIGKNSSCWYNAVIRGDVNTIIIGEKTNIQDNSVLHVSYDTQALRIGNGVTVGHSCVLHSCTLEDECLVGMKACVLDGAVVEKYAFVGAGALVTPNMHIPSGHLAVGVPAKIVRKLTDKEIQRIIDSSGHYLETARNHQAAYPPHSTIRDTS